MGNHHLMTSVKDEAPYIIEWVAHHLIVGFDYIFIAANDCGDGTYSLLKVLQRYGFIKFLKSHCFQDDIPQHTGYKALRERYDVDNCDWLMILDIDEFLIINSDEGTIDSLTSKIDEDIDIIAFNALTFGSEGDRSSCCLVTERFRYRLPEDHIINGSIKTITRNPYNFQDAHNHHLAWPREERPIKAIRADWEQFLIPKGVQLWKVLRHCNENEIAHGFGYYNHYSVKSKGEYLLRKKRGRGAIPATRQNEIRHDSSYFDARASAQVFDFRVRRYLPEVKRKIFEILEIPEISRLNRLIQQQHDFDLRLAINSNLKSSDYT